MDVKTNAPILTMISKICSVVALICFLFLIISSLALEDAGLFVAFILSAFASLIALVSVVVLLIMGIDKTGRLITMLMINIVLLLFYACVLIYFAFIVPAAVNATMNGG